MQSCIEIVPDASGTRVEWLLASNFSKSYGITLSFEQLEAIHDCNVTKINDDDMQSPCVNVNININTHRSLRSESSRQLLISPPVRQPYRPSASGRVAEWKELSRGSRHIPRSSARRRRIVTVANPPSRKSDSANWTLYVEKWIMSTLFDRIAYGRCSGPSRNSGPLIRDFRSPRCACALQVCG